MPLVPWNWNLSMILLPGKARWCCPVQTGDAYRYHTEETEVSITGGGTAILNNDYMPVVPTVVTTAETALSWSIGEDVFRKSVSAGTWTFPELELQEGQKSVSITGEGTTASGIGRDAYELVPSFCR